jgi:hypothetical protein
MSEADAPKKDGPSKKDLKKLAKKAEKSANKQQAKGGGGGGGGGGGPEKGGAAAQNEPKKLSSPPESFGLLNGDDSSSTLKVAVASTTWNISLKPKSASNRSDCAFLSMPALVVPDGSDNLVFGGNAILRAMSMMTKKEADKKISPLDPVVDDWLEWEHEVLRGCVADAAKKQKGFEAALETLVTALLSGDGLHVVGSNVTAVDISIVSTLYKDLDKKTVPSLPSSVEKYLKYQTSTPAFKQALALIPSLAPPVMPTYNPSDPSLDRATAAAFCEAIAKAFPQLDIGEILAVCKTQKCSSVKHGDYQCIAAMPLFGMIKANPTKFASCTARSPKDVAQSIVEAMPKDHPVVDASTLNLTGPGFIMCRLTASYLQSWMEKLILAGKPIPPSNLSTSTCVVDFSSPNIAKEMHVGHLRSTIIGESVCRVLEYAGNKVVRMNHVGGKYLQKNHIYLDFAA